MNGILNSSPPTPLPGATQTSGPKDFALCRQTDHNWQKQGTVTLAVAIRNYDNWNSPTIHLFGSLPKHARHGPLPRVREAHRDVNAKPHLRR
jgi:hypothetical protein